MDRSERDGPTDVGKGRESCLMKVEALLLGAVMLYGIWSLISSFF